MKKIMIAGISSGCGKTTICCGILQALLNRNYKIAGFKCGPDYIDPMFQRRILGTDVRNLDSFLLEKETLQQLFVRHSQNCDLSLIEGVMGYYDGVGMTDAASSHEIARLTKTPVVLVVSGKGMGRSLQALLSGYFDFERTMGAKGMGKAKNTASECTHYENSGIKGVIFNRIPDSMLLPLTDFCGQRGVTVLGNFPDVPEASLESRHLGLVTADEIKDWKEKLEKLAQAAEQTLRLDLLLKLSEAEPLQPETKKAAAKEATGECRTAKALEKQKAAAKEATGECRTAKALEKQKAAAKEAAEHRTAGAEPLRIAVARDLAFCFYYEDNLECLRQAGCELVEFSPLTDKKLPEQIDGLYLGGGYPEVFAGQLEANASMRRSIREQIGRGLVTFAECGGFLYLHTRLYTQDGKAYQMCGCLAGSCYFTKRLQHFGYSVMTAQEDNLFCKKGETLRVHEFHRFRSEIEQTAFRSEKQGKSWGSYVSRKNLLAGFPHIHFYAKPEVADNFLCQCRQYRRERQCIQQLQ